MNFTFPLDGPEPRPGIVADSLGLDTRTFRLLALASFAGFLFGTCFCFGLLARQNLSVQFRFGLLACESFGFRRGLRSLPYFLFRLLLEGAQAFLFLTGLK